jgi:hypothetical protein
VSACLRWGREGVEELEREGRGVTRRGWLPELVVGGGLAGEQVTEMPRITRAATGLA